LEGYNLCRKRLDLVTGPAAAANTVLKTDAGTDNIYIQIKCQDLMQK